jgi:DNA repair exonuclease SbcCD ATPase subunit
MPSAQVTAVDRLADFKSALQTFADRGKDAMSSNTMEIRRAQDWLTAQLESWKAEIRQAEQAVVAAKNELARKKMMRISDRPPDTTDQEKALRKAQARLAYAEEKRDNTRKWLRQLPDAVEEYDGVARPFQDMLEYELTRMIALIAAKINALEDYQRIQGAGETP